MESPSKILLGLEAARGIYEYSLGCLLNTPLQYISPKGDRHPVLVIPGLMGTDSSTQYIRNFLNNIGYNAQPWNMGRNLGPRSGMKKLLDDLVSKVENISESSGNEPVSLIGWSLGGIYCREIAKVCPHLIRQVITMGSPFKHIDKGISISRVYEMFSKDITYRDPIVIDKISQPPKVPFTSLYSRSDGVVHWKCSIEDETSISENIEIPGASHLGMGYNPIVMYIIANRLTYTKENWLPYILG